MSDARTATAAASRDAAAFARIVDAHHEPMARVAYVITGDSALTADALQSAWAIAWRRLPQLRDPARLRPWLVAIAANEARSIIRRAHRRVVTPIPMGIELPGGPDPADSISMFDLSRVLANLSPDDRRLLALRFVAELNSEEIARELGISASGARSRLERLLKKLRQELDHG
jgi:RNA polymerase sigma-70 factor (ECF subfamily)